MLPRLYGRIVAFKIFMTLTYLLKYSAMPSILLRIQSRQQRQHESAASLSRFCLRASTSAFKVEIMATKKLPKHTDPNDVVNVRKVDPRTAGEQQLFASSGENHHVPTTPATVTWTQFCTTSLEAKGFEILDSTIKNAVQYFEQNKIM